MIINMGGGRTQDAMMKVKYGVQISYYGFMSNDVIYDKKPFYVDGYQPQYFPGERVTECVFTPGEVYPYYNNNGYVNYETLNGLSGIISTANPVGAMAYLYAAEKVCIPSIRQFSSNYTSAYIKPSWKYIELPDLQTISATLFGSGAYVDDVYNYAWSAVHYPLGNAHTVTIPKCTNIFDRAFRYSPFLYMVSIGADVDRVLIRGTDTFANCRYLMSLYLMCSSVATLSNVYAFNGTPIKDGISINTGPYRYSTVYGSIYVPSALLSAYQSATNWNYYSSRFVGI